ncbi:MAG: 3-deoxy-D-manno-octulosonic acid transferase [Alphaproteobacteria bacterium]|nr:3-deoxy-D-manno-octulosonic acid transferase [Alphaproteobacteria bacterium]
MLYRLLSNLAAPAISRYLRRRLEEGREDASRFNERLGQSQTPRPPGSLVWCHAASVGEAMSVLSLISALKENYPETTILITTGTVTSAGMLSKRLPKDVIHQYVPVDRAPYIRKFLDHWKPDIALWIESELWPNTLDEMRKRRIPAVLLNGRMSEKSFRRWLYVKPWIKSLLSTFHMCLAQTTDEVERFKKLGAKDALYMGNLKYAAATLEYDQDMLEHLQAQIGSRPLWLMASTHKGEDGIAARVHKQLAKRWPDLVTIIVPRHPSRGEEIALEIENLGLTCSSRSKNQPITHLTSIYLADTMGELGLFYRLAPVTCIGGSFTWGGHNPVEAAQLGCSIVFGPLMTNFSAIAAEMAINNAAIQVKDEDELAKTIELLFNDPKSAKDLAQRAEELALEKSGVLPDIMKMLEPLLKPLKGQKS